jgi:glutamate N-acetyltransferase/amino-acid N-acetyltransferase
MSEDAVMPLAGPPVLPEMPPLAGVRIATAESATGYAGRPDMLLAVFDPGTTVAGVLTRSQAPAAPVRWTRERLANGDKPIGLVFNAGNANCYTGAAGHETVRRSAARAAEKLGCRAEEIYVCSTGRIGVPLPTETVLSHIDDMAGRLSGDGWHKAAEAMRTTDRWAKASARLSRIGDTPVTIYGITKGTTMIAPNMGTTISFVFTDARLPAKVLRSVLGEAVTPSFNCITVDHTTSTNDTMLMFATGKAKGQPSIADAADDALVTFRADLRDMLKEMALMLLGDARKDGKLVAVTVTGAESQVSARRIGRAVATSILSRKVLAAGDFMMGGISAAGRLLAAAGGAGEPVAGDTVTIRVGGAVVLESGSVVVQPPQAALDAVAGKDIVVEIEAGVGAASGTVWTVV